MEQTKTDRYWKCKQQAESEVDVELINKKFLETDVPEATCNPYLNTQPLCDNSFSFICISQSDVLASILHVKSDAGGLDNMSPKFVRLLLPLALPHVTYIRLLQRLHFRQYGKTPKFSQFLS